MNVLGEVWEWTPNEKFENGPGRPFPLFRGEFVWALWFFKNGGARENVLNSLAPQNWSSKLVLQTVIDSIWC